MRTTLGITLWLGIFAGFWYATTTTLDDMTRKDCRAGIERACDELKQAGLAR